MIYISWPFVMFETRVFRSPTLNETRMLCCRKRNSALNSKLMLGFNLIYQCCLRCTACGTSVCSIGESIASSFSASKMPKFSTTKKNRWRSASQSGNFGVGKHQVWHGTETLPPCGQYIAVRVTLRECDGKIRHYIFMELGIHETDNKIKKGPTVDLYLSDIILYIAFQIYTQSFKHNAIGRGFYLNTYMS